MKRGLLFLTMLLLCPALSLASAGGTDANGGHYDHTTGLYHYHHGYAAHQHENGICPYTGQVWQLKIPEKPATLEEWEAQKHAPGEVPTIDNETPENGSTGASGNALPFAAGGAVVLGGAAAWMASRRKKQNGQQIQADIAEPVQADGNASAEWSIPEDTVIGEDGLPWEKEAYDRFLTQRKTNPYATIVPTNMSAPKWGKRYSFCTDADGEEIHTMDCKLAFVQINVADPMCPKENCKICNPVRPDLSWYEHYRSIKKPTQTEDKKEQTA